MEVLTTHRVEWKERWCRVLRNSAVLTGGSALAGDLPHLRLPERLGFARDEALLPKAEIRRLHAGLFEGLPAGGFDPAYASPCWQQPRDDERGGAERPTTGRFVCLPKIYIIGMPKCGTSDLWSRLSRHPAVSTAARKETRFFTRGEHSRVCRPAAASDGQELDVGTPLAEFTAHHRRAATEISKDPSRVLIDGGPHTAWWSTQGAIARMAPVPQLLHALQPTARLVASLRNPVERMWRPRFELVIRRLHGSEGRSTPTEEIMHYGCTAQRVSSSPVAQVLGLQLPPQ
jgi:hypothetical protein